MKTGLIKMISRYGVVIATVFLVAFALGITMMTVSSIKNEFGMISNKTHNDGNIPVMGTLKPEAANKTETEEYTQTRPVGEEYILREYDGRIGVFRPENNEPIQVIQVYVMYLPEFDKQALQAGIRVIGEDELFGMIADFDG